MVRPPTKPTPPWKPGQPPQKVKEVGMGTQLDVELHNDEDVYINGDHDAYDDTTECAAQLEPAFFAALEEAKKSIPEGARWTVYIVSNKKPHIMYWAVEENKKYERELEAYNTRLAKYEVEKTQYEENMRKYELEMKAWAEHNKVLEKRMKSARIEAEARYFEEYKRLLDEQDK